MEEDKDKENNQLSANMSSSPSRGQVSFEMKSVEDYEEENRPMMITNNTMMNENSYRNKSILTSVQKDRLREGTPCVVSLSQTPNVRN